MTSLILIGCKARFLLKIIIDNKGDIKAKLWLLRPSLLQPLGLDLFSTSEQKTSPTGQLVGGGGGVLGIEWTLPLLSRGPGKWLNTLLMEFF